MLNVTDIVDSKVCRRWFHCRSHSSPSSIQRRYHIWLQASPGTPCPMIQDPVEAFLGSVFVSSPRWCNSSPPRSGVDREFEWIGSQVCPRYRDGFEVSGSKQMQVLKRVASSKLGYFLSHPHLLLVNTHDSPCRLVWPSSTLFIEYGGAQLD